ncbi:MAG: amidinotransferase [Gammaproteobacteria bacterium]|nr:amidinotransferase [Gammaproteobacteria bacterium]
MKTGVPATGTVPLEPVEFPVCARAAFLVAPEGFALAEQSATDNTYMDVTGRVDAARALAQHRVLHRALARHLPTFCFAGDPATPDAVFPNNVFATAPGRLILGHMRHPVRQAEAQRRDIRGFFTDVLGYAEIDLRMQPGVCELTGSMVIDRGRGIGYCGLSERCDPAGAAAMAEAFGLKRLVRFELAPGEYHANVVMSVLASRTLVLCPQGFSDPARGEAIAAAYGEAAILLDAQEKNAFAGNCIALTADTVFISEQGADSLRPATRGALQKNGFALHAVALDEIEKAGGSLRCCVAEIF